MAIYQDKAKERIKSNVNRIRRECRKGKKINMSEANTRAIVRAVLFDCLGWSDFDEVTEEESTKGGYCDFLIHYKEKPYIIVEVKKVSGGLREEHLSQAKHYAQDKGLEWVVLTNGDEWQVHNLFYNKKPGQNPEPDLFPLFTTSFTDTTIKPQDRLDYLYLLSKEAARNDELKLHLNEMRALTSEELTKRLLRKDVIDRIRIGIKNDTGVRVSDEELAKRLSDYVIRDDAKLSNMNYYIRKLSAKQPH